MADKLNKPKYSSPPSLVHAPPYPVSALPSASVSDILDKLDSIQEIQDKIIETSREETSGKVTVTDLRAPGVQNIVHGEALKFSANKNTISVYVDSGYVIHVPYDMMVKAVELVESRRVMKRMTEDKVDVITGEVG